MSIPKCESRTVVDFNPEIYEVIPVCEERIFDIIGHNPKTKTILYRLNAEKLSKDNCYIFYGREVEVNYLFIKKMRSQVFHSDATKDKLKIECVLLDKDFILYMCSFPKEFAEACTKAASVFSTVCGSRKQMRYIEDSRETIMQFPAVENILWAELRDGRKQDEKGSMK